MDFFSYLFGHNLFRLFSPGFSRAFLIFYMFSVIGWICEVLYVGIFFEHRFVNRGVLFGPLCPVYGFGGILILTLPKELQSPVWVLFISGLVFCSAVEYAAGYVLEKLFHTKWWDYSSKKIVIRGKTIPLHLHGRICLLNSTLFGIMTVCVIDFVHPLFRTLLNSMQVVVVQTVASGIGFMLFLDVAFSVHRLVDFNVYITRLKDLADSLKDRYGAEDWFAGKSLLESLDYIHRLASAKQEKFSESFIQKIHEARARHRTAESFVKKFPSMKNPANAESLLLIREKIQKRLDEKRLLRLENKSSAKKIR